MSVEQRPRRAPRRRPGPHTYFVGRRVFEAVQIFAVTRGDVERLQSLRRRGRTSLDWHGSLRARMELSDLLLSRVSEQRPSRELQGRFGLYVLAQLPDAGFVLDSDEIWRWLRLAGDPDDFVSPAAPPRSWAQRLRAPFRRTDSHRTTHARPEDRS